MGEREPHGARVALRPQQLLGHLEEAGKPWGPEAQ